MEDENKVVRDILDNEMKWDLSSVRTRLPNQIITEMAALPRSLEEKDDKLIWTGTPNGKFTISSAYRLLMPVENDKDPNWRKIWKLLCPQKLRVFLWLCKHNSLLTNALKFDRKFGESARCNCCRNDREDIAHVLKDCPLAGKIWELVVDAPTYTKIRSMQASTWLEQLIHMKYPHNLEQTWPWWVIVLATTWNIWKARNLTEYQQQNEPRNVTLNKIRSLASDMVQVLGSGSCTDKRTRTKLQWIRPNSGLVKLNSDGSYFEHSGQAAVGGIIRNADGDWIVGYTMKLGRVSIDIAELLGLRRGLQIAWERRFLKIKIEIEIDSEIVLNWVMRDDIGDHPVRRSLI